MSRISMRSTRLLSWRFLRWAIAIPTLPLIWWACTSHPLTQPTPAPEQQTDIYISVSPQRLLDLVFMVDNSPSMAPKVTKMNAQFKLLIEALRDPNDGTLPDLRVAVIDSDLGTGCQYSDGTACGRNNPYNPNPTGCFGDQGKFQMRTTPTACTFNGGAQFLQYDKGAAVNYTGNINDVFACLASNLGTQGCGQEHQLQAFEWALTGIITDTAPQKDAFLRGNAYLGLVFLSDEDDCSAMMNYGMFGNKTELANESASLRCATRGHMCGGMNLSQQNDPNLPGYPTTNKFTHQFADCKARLEDPCPNQTDGRDATDTSGPTSCAPLKDVRHLAAEIKNLKADPDNQILVAGIYGWPMGDPLSKQVDSNGKNEYQRNMDAAEYKIAMVPNPNSADVQHPQVYDYWPVCYDPDHQPTRLDSTTGFDTDAAGYGATGGLRESAFVDEFRENGLKFSICEKDFTRAMGVIGNAIAKKLQNLCVDYKLIDKDNDSSNGVQPDCRVAWRKLDPTTQKYKEEPTSMPQCAADATPDNISEDCWKLTSDRTKCPVNGQLIQVVRTRAEITAEPQIVAGTKVGMQCRTCTDPIPTPQNPDGWGPGCQYQL